MFTPQDKPRTGSQVGPYRLLREVGFGAAGAVYRALSTDGSVVALKVLAPDTADPRSRQRLRREVSALARIHQEDFCQALASVPELWSTGGALVHEPDWPSESPSPHQTRH